MCMRAVCVLCLCATCPVVQIEEGALVPDPTHLADGGDAGVLGVILGTEVLQLQDLGLPLQHTRTTRTHTHMPEGF